MSDDSPPPPPNGSSSLRNPIVFIAVAILSSVFVLIGAAIVSWDRYGRALRAMAETDFARGLITLLFSVVTIGTAMVLVVSALTANDDRHEKQFQRSKGILSLLLGVFGTMMGYYFGAEASTKGGQDRAVQIAPLRLGKSELAAGERFTLTTFVHGGRLPLRYGVAFGDDRPTLDETAEPNGWISKDLQAPAVTSEEDVMVKVEVRDADGHGSTQLSRLHVKPRPP